MKRVPGEAAVEANGTAKGLSIFAHKLGRRVPPVMHFQKVFDVARFDPAIETGGSASWSLTGPMTRQPERQRTVAVGQCE